MPTLPEISPNFHTGHMLMNCLKSRPDAVCQIDAATGKQEVNSSVRERSVRMARSLRAFGLKPGDVMALDGVKHLDLHIPYYAALFNGLPIVGVDFSFKLDEITAVFKLAKPSVAFCESDHYEYYMKAAKIIGLDTKVITFDDSDSSMKNFMEKYDVGGPIDDFQIANFDTEKIYSWLVSTGGTTGRLKLAAFKHKIWFEKIFAIMHLFKRPDVTKDSSINEPALNLSPLHWVSGISNAIGQPLAQQVMIQSSAPLTTEHVIDIINKYKPASGLISRATFSAILNSDLHCDFTCFNSLLVTGSKIHKDLVIEVRKRLRSDATFIEAYGQTENMGPVLMPNPSGPIGNCGRYHELFKVKLVHPETHQEITEPHVVGEMWTKGQCFSEYYNDPEQTAEVFTKDGWFKTGDLLYRDEEHNFYFVERMSMLIKYRSTHITPSELENVIQSHPGVLDASVTSIPNYEDGEWPVACVVRRDGAQVTAKEIKELVAEKLSPHKQLRGGVIFMDEIPQTTTGKVARSKLKQLVLKATRE